MRMRIVGLLILLIVVLVVIPVVSAGGICFESTDEACCTGAKGGGTCYGDIQFPSDSSQVKKRFDVSYCSAQTFQGFSWWCPPSHPLHTSCSAQYCSPRNTPPGTVFDELKLVIKTPSGKEITQVCTDSTKCSIDNVPETIAKNSDSLCEEGNYGFFLKGYVDGVPDATVRSIGVDLTVDNTEAFCTADCTNVLNVQWTGSQCCGNNGDADCGILGNTLCDYKDLDSPVKTYPDEPGEIQYLSCSNQQYLNNGTQWTTCFEGTQTVNNHDYVCSNTTGVETIVECCGTSPTECLSSGAGKRLFAGQSVIVNNEKLFCTSSGTLATTIGGDEAACLGAGETWTGTQCCAELTEKYYNDQFKNVGKSGGCFNSSFIPSGDTLIKHKEVINANGTFYSCKTEFTNKDNNSNNLITKVDQCQKFDNIKTAGNKNAYCSTQSIWKYTNEPGAFTEKPTAWDASTDCCSQTSCWDGNTCIQDETNKPGADLHNEYRCMAGTWVQQIQQLNWDASQKGNCPTDTQCLVDKKGDSSLNNQPDEFFNRNTGLPACIQDKQYINDFYCEEGSWSTRTKLVAKTLLDFAAGNDYALYCDTPEDSLPEYESDIFTCTIDGNRRACVNNVCILKYNNNVGFGVSLNTEIDGDDSFLKALGHSKNLCNSAKDSNGEFTSCSGNEGLWYDDTTNALIFLPSGTLATSTGATFDNFLTNPFTFIREFVFGKLHEKPSDWSFFDDTRIFNKLFAARKENKLIFSFLEEDQAITANTYQDYLGVYYENVDVDVCKLVQKYDNKAACERKGNKYVVVSQKFNGQQRLVDAWKDLSGKLRP